MAMSTCKSAAQDPTEALTHLKLHLLPEDADHDHDYDYADDNHDHDHDDNDNEAQDPWIYQSWSDNHGNYDKDEDDEMKMIYKISKVDLFEEECQRSKAEWNWFPATFKCF